MNALVDRANSNLNDLGNVALVFLCLNVDGLLPLALWLIHQRSRAVLRVRAGPMAILASVPRGLLSEMSKRPVHLESFEYLDEEEEEDSDAKNARDAAAHESRMSAKAMRLLLAQRLDFERVTGEDRGACLRPHDAGLGSVALLRWGSGHVVIVPDAPTYGLCGVVCVSVFYKSSRRPRSVPRPGPVAALQAAVAMEGRVLHHDAPRHVGGHRGPLLRRHLLAPGADGHQDGAHPRGLHHGLLHGTHHGPHRRPPHQRLQRHPGLRLREPHRSHPVRRLPT